MLLLKLIPLYFLILLGYIAGKHLSVQKETISALLIYIIYPVVVFTGVMNANVTPATLLLPVVVCGVACCLSLLFYRLSSGVWHDATRNLLAFGAGNANTGYFGVPVALALFGEEQVGIYILCIIGITFYENTLGFFITAKGHHTAKESLLKLAKLPTLYAFVLAVVLSLFDAQLPQLYLDTAASFRAAFTLLGMMIIGLGLAGVKKYAFDLKLVAMSFIAKFLAWPLFMVGIIALDVNFLHMWSEQIHKILLLIAIMPLAANMVVFATQLKTHPEKASLAVLLSTLFALLYIPLMVTLFLR